MIVLFYFSAVVALISTVLAITRLNPVHALLYVVVSFFSVAMIFFILGAPFIAALEVIIYAGAIVVLFLFVVMLLHLGREGIGRERYLIPASTWVGPGLLVLLLLVELIYVIWRGSSFSIALKTITPQQVGLTLWGPYLLGVEMASFLLLASLVGAFHLGRHENQKGEALR